jgi:hypothetical protein
MGYAGKQSKTDRVAERACCCRIALQIHDEVVLEVDFGSAPSETVKMAQLKGCAFSTFAVLVCA